MSDQLACSFAVPLIAIDRILHFDKSGIITHKDVVKDEPFFVGHFPSFPIYPGVFILEAVHQAASYYGRVFLGRVRLLEVRSARFVSPVHPGDVLESNCRCEVIRDTGDLKVEAICHCGTQKVAEVKLVYRMEDQIASQSRAD